MTQCMRHPRRSLTPAQRCSGEATHIYPYLLMPLCDACAIWLRDDIRRWGFDDVELIQRLDTYTGRLHDGTEYRNGEPVEEGTAS